MANSIQKFPVPLILKKVLKDSLNGELSITTNTFTKNLYFINGRLEFATSSLVKERLGDLLLAAGKITPVQFAKLTRIKEHSDRRTGEILAQITHLQMKDIFAALKFQVKTIAVSSFSLTEGEWKFTTVIPNIPQNQKLSLKLPYIISEGVRQIPDFDYYKTRFNLRSAVTAPIPETTGQYMSTNEIKFYVNLTRFPNISVEQLIQNLKLPEAIFWRQITSLYLLNVVDFAEYTVDEVRNEHIETVNDLFEKIQEGKLDFYKLFGLKNTASVQEVKETYFDYSRKYHPDRFTVPPDSTSMMKANAVFAEINKAYEALSTPEKKREYDLKATQEHSPKKSDKLEQVKKARECYLKANALYKKKMYREAVSLMEGAIQMDPGKASYHMLLGLSQSKIPALCKMAEANFMKVKEMEPWNADPMFALGELYRAENLIKRAEGCYKKALELNMEHTLAGKAFSELNMGVLLGKKK